MSIVIGKSDTPNEIAVSGTAFPEAPPGATNIGVKGDGGVGIFIPVPGVPIKGIAIGVFGTSAGAGVGVQGVNSDNKAMGFLGGIDPRFNQLAGVYGESGQQGIIGHATNDTGTGVFGDSTGGGFGVRGETSTGTAVQGQSFNNGFGVVGKSIGGQGVQGSSSNFNGVEGHGGKNGVLGESSSSSDSGVVGINNGGGFGVAGTSSTGVGIFGFGSKLAGRFDGDVEVSGDIRLTGGQDCAEDFDISGGAEIEPGTVMVLGNDGALQMCRQAYDKRVAGVISGAADFKPGIILGRQESQNSRRMPIALLGKVYCKADATSSPIAAGDLLTTSPTSGHAMRAADPTKAFGAVIGKALRPLDGGCGLIPILIALQ
jgi:hypothetical protein